MPFACEHIVWDLYLTIRVVRDHSLRRTGRADPDCMCAQIQTRLLQSERNGRLDEWGPWAFTAPPRTAGLKGFKCFDRGKLKGQMYFPSRLASPCTSLICPVYLPAFMHLPINAGLAD